MVRSARFHLSYSARIFATLIISQHHSYNVDIGSTSTSIPNSPPGSAPPPPSTPTPPVPHPAHRHLIKARVIPLPAAAPPTQPAQAETPTHPKRVLAPITPTVALKALGPTKISTKTLGMLKRYRPKKTRVLGLQGVPQAQSIWIVERAIAIIKVVRKVGLMDKGSSRAMISSNSHPATPPRKVASVGFSRSLAVSTASRSSQRTVSRAAMASNRMASNRTVNSKDMVSNPTVNNRATAPPSTGAILNKDTVVVTEDPNRVGMEDISSRLQPRAMVWVPVVVRRWAWVEVCWVACYSEKQWTEVMEVVTVVTVVEVMTEEGTAEEISKRAKQETERATAGMDVQNTR